MALVTLSGAISAADLNTNFADKQSTINTNAQSHAKDIAYRLQVLALSSATSVGARTLDITVADDCELRTLALWVASPDATSRTATATLTAIDATEADISDVYLLGQTVSVSKAMSSGTTGNATRTDYTPTTSTKVVLIKGITYRLQLSGTASAFTACVATLVVRQIARRR